MPWRIKGKPLAREGSGVCFMSQAGPLLLLINTGDRRRVRKASGCLSSCPLIHRPQKVKFVSKPTACMTGVSPCPKVERPHSEEVCYKVARAASNPHRKPLTWGQSRELRPLENSQVVMLFGFFLERRSWKASNRGAKVHNKKHFGAREISWEPFAAASSFPRTTWWWEEASYISSSSSRSSTTKKEVLIGCGLETSEWVYKRSIVWHFVKL